MLEPGAIEWHVLRDAIDHHVVSARLALNHLVDLDKLGGDIFAAGFLIHPLDKRRRKTVFLSKKNSDFFHNCFAVISSVTGGEVEKSLDVSNVRNPATAGDFARHDKKRVYRFSLTPDFSPVITATHGNKAVSTALSRQGVCTHL